MTTDYYDQFMDTDKYLQFKELYEELKSAVDRAVVVYNREAGKQGLKTRTWVDGSIINYVEETYTDSIVVEYMEEDRCGRESGSFRIPLPALCDDTYTEFIKTFVKSQREDELLREQLLAQETAERQAANRRKQYEELKKEFEAK